MSTAARTHRKLPGGGFNWTGRGKLWQGPDHVLEVTSVLVVEQYRRFFFHDIKAFAVHRTKVLFGWALVQGGFGLVCTLAAGVAWWIGKRNAAEDWHVALYVVAGIFGGLALLCFLLLGINLLLGPSCRCHMLTPTGWHALTAPTRLGPALRAQALLIPLIEAAQAPLAGANPETP